MSERTILFNARLIDPASGRDETGGVVFENGVITDIGPHISRETERRNGVNFVRDAGGKVLAPGLIDLRVKTGEPGAESKETLATAGEAAAAGGVTTFVVMPDTDPVIDSVALVDFIKRRADGVAKVKIRPTGGLTVGLEGKKMAELGLIAEAGAAFFTNGDHPVEDAGLMRRAMQYASGFDALIASRPDTAALSRGTVMTAGAFAARLGLRGAPPEAEWIALERDLMLAETTGARLLVDCISTARSLEAVERARAKGVKVACSVAAYSLFFNEIDVGDYLTYCKVQPPFRTEADRMALVEGLARGAIDAVVSAHDPQPPEDKRLPIADASFGAIGLETLLPALLKLVAQEQISLAQALRPVTCGPASLLGLPQGRLETGAPADLVLFDPDTPWLCDRDLLLSRSKNSPFDGRRLEGRVLQTWVDGRTVFERK
ncbi:MAG: amidohydrolase family protein [Alphaproteobacteria bacterium]|nr:amidohydrolase family protein [Alphaproteobacteria bacterium]